MTNTSATGGYLVPTPSPAPQPLEDAALAGFFQRMVAGVTGVTGNLVRPRWQPEAPAMPSADITWIAIGIVNRKADTNAYTEHLPNEGDDGADVFQRHEELELLCSAYGPNAEAAASNIRDGLFIAQNRELLQLAGMGIISVGDILYVPTFENEKYYPRVDVSVFIRREILRVYPVLHLLSASGTITTADDVLNVPFSTNP